MGYSEVAAGGVGPLGTGHHSLCWSDLPSGSGQSRADGVYKAIKKRQNLLVQLSLTMAYHGLASFVFCMWND